MVFNECIGGSSSDNGDELSINSILGLVDNNVGNNNCGENGLRGESCEHFGGLSKTFLIEHHTQTSGTTVRLLLKCHVLRSSVGRP